MASLRYNLDAGRHNNIPRCCTLWFLLRYYSGWPRLIGHGNFRYRWWCAHREISRRLFKDADYIRCPKCALLRQAVDIHTCTTACAGQKGATPNRTYPRKRS